LGFLRPFSGIVGFREKHDVGNGVVEKLGKLGFMVQMSICVPRGGSKGVSGQNGIRYLWKL
jgi:hypothetical protein